MKSGVTWARRQAARSVQSVEQPVNARRGAAWGASPSLGTPHSLSLQPLGSLDHSGLISEKKFKAETQRRAGDGLDGAQSDHLLTFSLLYVNYPITNYVPFTCFPSIHLNLLKVLRQKRHFDHQTPEEFNSPTVEFVTWWSPKYPKKLIMIKANKILSR